LSGSGGSNRSSNERYRDSPTSSASSTYEPENNINSMKLKTNLISFGDTMKHKLGGLFFATASKSSNTEQQQHTPSSLSEQQRVNHVAATVTPPSTTNNHHYVGNSGEGGRVFGRANNGSNPGSRPTSPNPFLSASNRQQNSNTSPFARFGAATSDNSNSRTPPPPSNNIFDDI
jgi:hypothetical protein